LAVICRILLGRDRFRFSPADQFDFLHDWPPSNKRNHNPAHRVVSEVTEGLSRVEYPVLTQHTPDKNAYIELAPRSWTDFRVYLSDSSAV
jgi:hypothetical protein